MEEVLNVFGVVEGGRGRGRFGGFLLIARLAWIDACDVRSNQSRLPLMSQLRSPLKIHRRRKSGSEI